MFFFKLFKMFFCISLLFFVFKLTYMVPMTFSQTNTSQNDLQNNKVSNDKITYTFDWEDLSFTSYIHNSWNPNAKNIYEMPNTALEYIEKTLPTLLAKIIDTIPSLHGVSLLQFMHQYDLQQSYFRDILQNTQRIQYIPNEDLFGLTIIYKTQLLDIFAQDILNHLSQINIPKRAVLPGIVEQSYTALVFFVEGNIPSVENAAITTQFEPKLFPKVFAEDGTLVYSPEYYDKSTFTSIVPDTNTNTKLPFKYVYAQNLDTQVFGTSPLVVVPLYTNAIKWPDIIISNEYADRILGSLELHKHIKNGKVFFIISTSKPHIIKSETNQKE